MPLSVVRLSALPFADYSGGVSLVSNARLVDGGPANRPVDGVCVAGFSVEPAVLNTGGRRSSGGSGAVCLDFGGRALGPKLPSRSYSSRRTCLSLPLGLMLAPPGLREMPPMLCAGLNPGDNLIGVMVMLGLGP